MKYQGLFLSVLMLSVTHAEDWQLVYEDDFEREEPGPAWVLIDKYDGRLLIENGELVGDGNALIMFAYPVPGDQKVVFEGRWVEGTGRSTTQFAGLLKCSPYYGFLSGVGLIHGRSSNRFNTVEFLGWSGRVARNTGPLPEPGKKYTFEAAVEGTHTYLKRDGELIIEGKLPFVLDGPPFDRIMLYANEMRIRFDSIKIYRKGRESPIVLSDCPLPTVVGSDGLPVFAGDDPDGLIAKVVKTHREGNSKQALEDAKQIKDPRQKLNALLMLANDPMFEPYFHLCKEVTRHLKANPQLEPKQRKGALTLGDIARKMKTAIHSRSSQSAGMASYLMARMNKRHPFYGALLFHHGRNVLLGEGGISTVKQHEGYRVMHELFMRDIRNDLVKMYLGEKVPWGEQYISREPGVPQWARTIRETHARLLHILTWWATVRQRPDGQIGGGWGDDVETLRAWGPVLAICDANQPVRAAMKRLVDGAWKYAEGGLELGYSKKKWDVEHSAEPSADTQPLMLLFAPDDLVYVERNKLLVGLTRDKWTAKASNGHRMFKSVQMSALEVDDAPEARASTPYHNRAIKGLTWLAWAYDDPQVESLWLEIADGWVEATLREEAGKLSGVVPAAVDVVTGKLGAGNGDWYRPGLGWSYYNWDAANHHRIYGLLTAAYLETGDEKYMLPVFTSLQQALAYAPQQGYEPPLPEAGSDAVISAERQRFELRTWRDQGMFVPYLLAYQHHSGKNTYANELRNVLQSKTLNPVARYQIDGNVDALVRQFEQSLEDKLRYNLPMATSQVQRTDDLKRLPHTADLYSLMTGALKFWGDSFWPTHLVTFGHPSTDWAALTRRVSGDHINIRFFNFDTNDDKFALTFWHLKHGDYQLRIQTETGEVLGTQILQIDQKRQVVNVTLPAGKPLQLDLKVVK